MSDFIEPFCYQAEEANKVLDYHIQPGLKATVDRQLVTELLAILFENALKYTEAGDLIRCGCSTETIWLYPSQTRV